MPQDDSVIARLWVVQSREKARNAGKILSEIGDTLSTEDGKSLTNTAVKLIGAANPWIAIGTGILGLGGIVGGFLNKSKDKKMGFVNLDESFTPEEIDLGELDRSNTISSFGTLSWTWVIEDE